MANSRFEYVKCFERPDNLLPNTWIVVRLDGRGFHKFSDRHNFTKPNDLRAIELMNAAAVAVLRDVTDIILGYGVSDEYSFILDRNCSLFERRESKIVTTIVSTFTSYYTYLWPQFFPDTPLVLPLPTFDGRAVCYPTTKNLRDYLAWRQVDCHINNLYNTTFWTLVQVDGMSNRDAEKALMGTYSKDKHEILWKHGINYSKEPEVWKKGSVVFRDLKEKDKQELIESLPGKENTSSVKPSTAFPESINNPEIGLRVTGAGTSQQGENNSLAEEGIPELPSKKETTPLKVGTPPQEKSARGSKAPTASKLVKMHKRLLKASEIVVQHVDIIEDRFYLDHPYILGTATE